MDHTNDVAPHDVNAAVATLKTEGVIQFADRRGDDLPMDAVELKYHPPDEVSQHSMEKCGHDELEGEASSEETSAANMFNMPEIEVADGGQCIPESGAGGPCTVG